MTVFSLTLNVSFYVFFLLISLPLHNAPLLTHVSNLHSSHPAVPPLDVMAQVISVGDTQDTEGRTD